jgi:hypothetical protein
MPCKDGGLAASRASTVWCNAFRVLAKKQQIDIASVDTTIETVACFERASGLIGTCRAPLLFPIGTSSLEPFLSTSRSSNSGTIIGAGILRGTARRLRADPAVSSARRAGANVPGKRVPR